jgi:hypothetical protein
MRLCLISFIQGDFLYHSGNGREYHEILCLLILPDNLLASVVMLLFCDATRLEMSPCEGRSTVGLEK